MSYDDYAIHILQKYRLAITLAVLKTKPEHISIEDYIEQLRNKLNTEEMDFEDCHISIDSDDFKLDEINDFSDNIPENSNEIPENNIFLTKINDNLQENEQINSRNQIHRSQNEFNEDVINTQDLNESITILENFPHADDVLSNTGTNQRESLTEVMNILKGIDGRMMDIDQAASKIDQLKSQQNVLLSQVSDQDLTQCLTNIEMTQCDSIDMPKQIMISQEHNPKGIGQTTDNGGQKSYHNKNQECYLDGTRFEKTNIKPRNCGTSSNVDEKFNTMHENRSNDNALRSYRHTKEFQNVYQNVASIFETNKKDMKDIANIQIMNKTNISKQILEKPFEKQYQDITDFNNARDNNNLPSTLQKDYNSLTQDFTCNTHYSQSQINDFHMDDKYIHGIKRQNTLNNDSAKTEQTIIKKRKDVTIIIKDEIFIKPNVENVIRQKNMSIDLYKTTDDKKISNMCIDEHLEKTQTKLKEVTNIDHSINISSQQDIFAQEFPEVLIPSQNAENVCTFGNNVLQDMDKNELVMAKENIRFIHEGDANIMDVNANTNKQQEESQLFYQNSQPDIPLHLVSSQNYRNIDSLRFQQNTSNFKNTIYKHDDTKIYKERKNSSTDFKNNCDSDLFGNANFDSLQNIQIRKGGEIDKTLINTENGTLNEKLQNCDYLDTNVDSMQVTEDKNTANTENKKSNTKLNEDRTNIEQDKPNMTQTENFANFDDNLQEIEEFTDSDTDKVPFKIIEELNKVKIYLNKRVEKSQKGYSSDTGYRSDSSAKTSLKSSQTSVAWVDQSAHSLFNYLTSCPLVSATQDITREISIVLGQVIDKLQEEEKYPAFLEDMLNSIQTMLDLVYEEHNQDNELSKKDEYVHRIMLFNKSLHIQKYTIEKITKNLENLHKELSATDTDFEIKNVNKMDNICYIFHLLEIILIKYSKKMKNSTQNSDHLTQNTQISSQNTQSLSQNSQEDEKLLRKSGITDIWRKKWNSNFKETQNEASPEKINEISKCCAILNKLIVDCMEGYSLVSYFALKCFNVMQN